jgi:hypothetical protein
MALRMGLVAVAAEAREARCEARREANRQFFDSFKYRCLAFVLLVVLLVKIFGKSRFLVALGCSEVIRSTKLC